jgi:hypothetical protein
VYIVGVLFCDNIGKCMHAERGKGLEEERTRKEEKN